MLSLTNIPSVPPAIVIVFSTPDPVATTPAPVKLRVVARVDNALSSSSIVIPAIPACATHDNPEPVELNTDAAAPTDPLLSAIFPVVRTPDTLNCFVNKVSPTVVIPAKVVAPPTLKSLPTNNWFTVVVIPVKVVAPPTLTSPVTLAIPVTFNSVPSNVKLALAPKLPPLLNWIWLSEPAGTPTSDCATHDNPDPVELNTEPAAPTLLLPSAILVAVRIPTP